MQNYEALIPSIIVNYSYYFTIYYLEFSKTYKLPGGASTTQTCQMWDYFQDLKCSLQTSQVCTCLHCNGTYTDTTLQSPFKGHNHVFKALKCNLFFSAAVCILP